MSTPVRETAVTFGIDGTELVGVVSHAEQPNAAGRGVLILVGGPQYRVGSHRQFVLLARRLAAEGYPCFRFDYRGMGDSDGGARHFTDVAEDIDAAIVAFRREFPAMREVALWALCDAACAALIHGPVRAEVKGMVLLNPWVRSDATLAKTHLKHYYGARLLSGEFWRNVISGRFRVIDSVRGLLRSILAARSGSKSGSGSASESDGPFQSRMAGGLRRFRGRTQFIISGNDLTAREFMDFARTDAGWTGLMKLPTVETVELPEADHTFSSAQWRGDVESLTLRWLRSW